MKRYALYPGCVAKGAGRELFTSTMNLARRLDIEFIEMKNTACCGAGFIEEDNPLYSDSLNARTFAIAEEMNLDIITICSTCQGVMKKAEYTMKRDKAYLRKVNEILKDGGHTYQGGKIKALHLLNILAEQSGLELLRNKTVSPLKRLKVAPFYGCYLVRPREYSLFEDPDNTRALEDIIDAIGAEPVQFSERLSCCGFPVLMMNKMNALRLTEDVIKRAKEQGADCIVTPCPLCHLNLDAYQPDIEQTAGSRFNIPILHLSQLIGMAVGISMDDLGIKKHIVDTTKIVTLLHGEP